MDYRCTSQYFSGYVSCTDQYVKSLAIQYAVHYRYFSLPLTTGAGGIVPDVQYFNTVHTR